MDESSKTYDVTEPRDERWQGPLCIRPGDEQIRTLLSIPSRLDTRIIDLAQRIAGDSDPLTRVRKLQIWLRSTHAYSTTFDSKIDPLTDFILNRRAAHCQYFATALVMMARCAGVPARYVSGFYAHESYGANQTVVRDRDGHAWAECWIDGIGWITADATPASGMPDALFPRAPWEQWGERMMDALRDGWNSVTRTPAKTFFTLLGVAAAVVGGGAFMRYLWVEIRGWKRLRHRAYAGAGEQISAAAQRFERWLRSTGAVVPASRTWKEQLADLHDSVGGAPAAGRPAPLIAPERLATATQFVQAYDQARFGAGGEEDLERVDGLMRLLEQRD
jgi:hypothetical protein